MGLVLAAGATSTLWFAGREQFVLARDGVHGYAEVVSVGRNARENHALLSIDGRKPMTTSIHPRDLRVGQIMMVTYNPRDLTEIHRGWGTMDRRADIAMVIALVVDVGAGLIIARSVARKPPPP